MLRTMERNGLENTDARFGRDGRVWRDGGNPFRDVGGPHRVGREDGTIVDVGCAAHRAHDRWPSVHDRRDLSARRRKNRGPRPSNPCPAGLRRSPAARTATHPQDNGHGVRGRARSALAGAGGGRRSAALDRPGRRPGARAGRGGRKRGPAHGRGHGRPSRATRSSRVGRNHRGSGHEGLGTQVRHPPSRCSGCPGTDAPGDVRQWPLPAVSYQP